MSTKVLIGVDVLMLDRFRRLALHERFRRLLFTPAELAQAPKGATNRLVEYLAGRFAAKEAVVKVLGTGFLQGVAWRDVEVTRDARGGPSVTLHDGARSVAEKRGVGDIVVSITHQGPLVVSVAAGTGR